MTDFNQGEETPKTTEWIISKTSPRGSVGQTEHDQGYGDLTELNSDGIILQSIGPELLRDFANDYLELLGSSSAIYEANGDYAFGIFSSGWCRMMDSASRKLCETSDNNEAIDSGRWLCHESCWTNCSKAAIAKGVPVDIECSGGIRLYAEPIIAHGRVVGAINFGYGDPPKDAEKLRKLAEAYQVDYDDLVREAHTYESRPAYIVEMAKNRLRASARLIGSMIETKESEEEAKRHLKEREILLKEVHHRIKNNFASIEGLLSMQADSTSRLARNKLCRSESLSTNSSRTSSSTHSKDGMEAMS